MPQNPRKQRQYDDIDEFLVSYAQQRIDEEADRQGVPRDFARRIARAESTSRPEVITGRRRSTAGAIGTMQLMPGTAKDLGVDPYDLDQNISGGVRYLKQQIDAFGGDLTKAAAAYNAGPGNVRKFGGVPPFKETQDYVQKTVGDQPKDDIDEFLERYYSQQPTVIEREKQKQIEGQQQGYIDPKPFNSQSKTPFFERKLGRPTDKILKRPQPNVTNPEKSIRMKALRNEIIDTENRLAYSKSKDSKFVPQLTAKLNQLKAVYENEAKSFRQHQATDPLTVFQGYRAEPGREDITRRSKFYQQDKPFDPLQTEWGRREARQRRIDSLSDEDKQQVEQQYLPQNIWKSLEFLQPQQSGQPRMRVSEKERVISDLITLHFEPHLFSNKERIQLEYIQERLGITEQDIERAIPSKAEQIPSTVRGEGARSPFRAPRGLLETVAAYKAGARAKIAEYLQDQSPVIAKRLDVATPQAASAAETYKNVVTQPGFKDTSQILKQGEKWIGRITGGYDPNNPDWLTGKIPRAVGSSLPYAVGGGTAGLGAKLLGGGAGAIRGATMGASYLLGSGINAADIGDQVDTQGETSPDYWERRRQGIMAGQAAGGLESVLGVGANVPRIAGLLKRPSMGLRMAGTQFVKGSAEEAIQEPITEGLNAINEALIAKTDPNALKASKLLPRLGEAAALGGIVGSTFNAGQLAGSVRDVRNANKQKQTESDKEHTEWRAKPLIRPTESGTQIINLGAIKQQQQAKQSQSEYEEAIAEANKIKNPQQRAEEIAAINEYFGVEEASSQQQAQEEISTRIESPEPSQPPQIKPDTRTDAEAQREINRMRKYDAAMEQANKSSNEWQSLFKSGDKPGALGKLRAQKSALIEAKKVLPDSQEGLATKVNIDEQIEQITNQMRDLRKAKLPEQQIIKPPTQEELPPSQIEEPQVIPQQSETPQESKLAVDSLDERNAKAIKSIQNEVAQLEAEKKQLEVEAQNQPGPTTAKQRINELTQEINGLNNVLRKSGVEQPKSQYAEGRNQILNNPETSKLVDLAARGNDAARSRLYVAGERLGLTKQNVNDVISEHVNDKFHGVSDIPESKTPRNVIPQTKTLPTQSPTIQLDKPSQSLINSMVRRGGLKREDVPEVQRIAQRIAQADGAKTVSYNAVYDAVSKYAESKRSGMPVDELLPQPVSAQKKISHSRFGDVTVDENQSGVEVGKLRVVDKDGKTHTIQNPRTTGNRDASYTMKAQPEVAQKVEQIPAEQKSKPILVREPVQSESKMTSFKAGDRATHILGRTRMNGWIEGFDKQGRTLFRDETGNVYPIKEGKLAPAKESSGYYLGSGFGSLQGLNRKQLSDLKSNLREVSSFSRAVLSSGDISAPLRQGAILTLPPTQWKRAANASIRMLQSFNTEQYERIKGEIHSHKDAGIAKRTGLYLATDETSALSQREEVFMSKLAGRLPVIKQSEQAYKTYLDSLRIDTFERYKGVIDKQNLSFTQKMKAYKAAAKWINYATGRGSLGERGDKYLTDLSTVLFAPRYAVSRFNVLNPYMYYKNRKENPVVFKEQMRDLVGYAGMLLLTHGLLVAAGGEEEKDPYSKDFGKVRFGNTRYDLFSGLLQPVRLMLRVGNDMQRAMRGLPVQEGTNKSALDEVRKFLRGKLAPVPSFFVDMISRKDFTGKDFRYDRAIISRVAPLMWKDLVEAYMEENWTGVAKTLPGALGVGVQTFEKRAGDIELKNKKLSEELDKHGLKYGFINKQDKDEPDKRLEFRGDRAQQWFDKYGSELIQHGRFKSAKPELQKKALEILKERISGLTDEPKPKLEDLATYKIINSARDSLKKEAENKKKKEKKESQLEQIYE